MNQHQFFRLGGYVDLLDLGPGSPGNGLSLVVPTWGVAEEARIKMLLLQQTPRSQQVPLLLPRQ